MAFSDFLDSHFYTTVLGLEFCRQMRNWIVQRRTIITFEDQDQSEKLRSRMELSERAEGGEPLPTWVIFPAQSTPVSWHTHNASRLQPCACV
jgi:hypothetical protein